MTTVYNEDDTIWAPPDSAIDDNGAVYASIQSAIDSAGNWVLVGPGTYDEELSVQKDEFVLSGAGASTHIQTTTDGPAISIDGADDITVKDLKVTTSTSFSNDAIVVGASSRADRILTASVRVPSSGNHGINFSTSFESVAAYCHVGTQNTTIGGDGIRLDSEGTATGCHIDTTSGDGIEMKSFDCVATGNTIDSCDVGVRASTENALVGNAITLSTNQGVVITGDENTVVGNWIRDNGGEGLRIETSNNDDNVIVGNGIRNNGGTDDLFVSGDKTVLGLNRYGSIDTSNATNLMHVGGVSDSGFVPLESPGGAIVTGGGVEDGSNNKMLDSVADTGQVSLSSGTAVVDTGISATDATFNTAIGIDDPNADAKVTSRVFWDDSAGTYKVEFVEESTSVNPTVNYDIIRVR